MAERRKYERTPDTLGMLGSLVIAAAILAVSQEVPGSLQAATATGLAATVWAVGFGLSAILALAGVLWREALTGWLLELVGRLGLAAAMTGYGIALIGAATSWRSSLAILLIFGVVGGSLFRVGQIVSRLRGVVGALRTRLRIKGARR